MALKHKIAQLTDVAEAVRGEYSQGNDGAFYLQVEGMVPKAHVDEFRNNNIELSRKISELEQKYKDIDPVKYAELVAANAKTPEAIENAVKQRLAQLTQEHAQLVQTKDGEIVKLKTSLDSVLIDGSLKTEAAKAGILPTALDDVVLRGRTVFKNENGQVIAYNERGEKMYDKDGTTPLGVSGWVKGLKSNAPHLFAGMNGGGAGGSGGGGAGGLDMSKATPTQKIQAGLAAMRE